jgi:tetratricopeptide (TPR) repeat protein
MKNQLLSGGWTARLPRTLALLPIFLAVLALPAVATVTLTQTEGKLELKGGQGKNQWTLTYGTSTTWKRQAVLAEVSPTRAYFSHGDWLRLLDTGKGVVIGRWHFPGEITEIHPAGGDSAEIIYQERTYATEDVGKGKDTWFTLWRFDPSKPQLPPIYISSLMLLHVPNSEGPKNWTSADTMYRVANVRGTPAFDAQREKAAKAAQQFLPQAEALVARDPLSPSVRLILGRLLWLAKDPRAHEEYAKVLATPGSDFTEWFRISAALYSYGEHELAGQAFERAYQDFWQRDNDPRLLVPLITRLILFSDWSRNPEPSEAERRYYVERYYRIAPYAEGAAFAWELYARQLERQGSADAKLWQARADDVRRNGDFMGFADRSFNRRLDRLWLLIPGAVLAAIFYFVVINRRYRNQQRLDMAAGRSRWRLTEAATLRYWSSGERIGFLLLGIVAWAAIAIVGNSVAAILRSSSTPISAISGNLAGPVSEGYFRSLPPTPGRDLLLAQNYLQSGDLKNAEQAYRTLPQFAEAWNNLGVTLKLTGRDAEARQAFERALALDPQLHEAALNLGRGPSDFWTQMHQQYAPERPMIAPPSAAAMRAAYQGGAGLWFWTKTIASGPFWLLEEGPSQFTGGSRSDSNAERAFLIVVFAAVVLAFAGAVALVFFVSHREVTQAPGKRFWILELLFPGTAPAWGALGGLVLLATCYFVFQLIAYWRLETPYIFTYLMVPNIARAFLVEASMRDVFALFGPGRLWLYGAPITLFVVNAALVLRARLAQRSKLQLS